MQRKIICVVGPTASGKTSLAVWLAKKIRGEIISADSRQVFKKLDIGTSKDLDGYKKVKYHLIDVCEPGEEFTLFDWLELARAEIKKLFAEDKVPIVTGGTGLYVQALTEGFQINQKSKIKNQNLGVASRRFVSRKQLDQTSLEKLQKIYLQFKIQNSNIDLNNPRRIIRAIERAQEGSELKKTKPDFGVLQIGIIRDREELYNRIDGLVEQWFDEGLLEEVKDLMDSGVSTKWLHDIGLEYRIVSEYIIDGCKPEEFDTMKQKLKFAIHHYARRQITWFKRFPEIKWVQDKNEALKIAKSFLK